MQKNRVFLRILDIPDTFYTGSAIQHNMFPSNMLKLA